MSQEPNLVVIWRADDNRDRTEYDVALGYDEPYIAEVVKEGFQFLRDAVRYATNNYPHLDLWVERIESYELISKGKVDG